ncbi:MAG TPA: hypothetical protein VL918_14320 [Sphingobium sp.]|nr:hypothetical protein [Sphingobium sp.]
MQGRAEHFYDHVGWHPVWTEEASAALVSPLAERARHGLDHVHFLEETPIGDALVAYALPD